MTELTFTTQSQLLHHGIEGQKWGVQNGPPYPLDRKTAKEVKKQAYKEMITSDAYKKMNKATIIGNIIGGPLIGAAASQIALKTMDAHMRDNYNEKVQNYIDAKKQYKEVKKYEKVKVKDLNKYSKILDPKIHYSEDKFLKEAKKAAQKQQKKIDKKSDKELVEDLRKEGDKIFARVERTGGDVTKSELRNFGDKYMKLREKETGQSYKSFDDFMKKEFNGDWNSLERELKEIAF